VREVGDRLAAGLDRDGDGRGVDRFGEGLGEGDVAEQVTLVVARAPVADTDAAVVDTSGRRPVRELLEGGGVNEGLEL